MSADGMLDAADVMKRFGYKDRKSFWQFVHKHKVPHVKFNARVIRFEEGPLEEWLANRRRGIQSGRRVRLPTRTYGPGGAR